MEFSGQNMPCLSGTFYSGTRGPTNWPDQPDHISEFLELVTGVGFLPCPVRRELPRKRTLLPVNLDMQHSQAVILCEVAITS